jgi:hypothetical protein
LLKLIKLLAFLIPVEKALILIEKNSLKIFNLILNSSDLNVNMIVKEIKII